jgi:hypothetical protein
MYIALISLVILIPLSESQGQEINDNPFRSQPSPDFGQQPSPDFGQQPPQSGLTDVVGTYVNPDIGFQVDLPKDWKGKELKFLADLVFASPNEISLSEAETLPGTLMTISGTDQETFSRLAEFASLAGAGGQGGGMAQAGSPLDIVSASGNNISCNNLPSSFVSINGIKAEQISQECKDEEGTDLKGKGYAFSTQDDSLIVIGFLSNSTAEYDQYLPLFEESVKTIKISQPGDIATSQTYKKAKELEAQPNQTLG